MHTTYVRLSDEAHGYLVRLSGSSGISMTGVIDLVILEARRRGWTVDTSAPRVKDTDDSPAPIRRDTGRAPAAPGTPPPGARGPVIGAL